MKTKTIQLFSAIVLIALTSIIYSGCKKKEDPKPKNANAAGDNSNAECAFAGIWKQISTVTDSSNTLRASTSTCATASIAPFDLVTWPKTVVIDFGTVNCLGDDFNNRRGIITAVFSGPYLDSGTVIIITLTSYYHNDYHIQGTQTITNKGYNSSAHLVYNVIVNSAIVTHPTDGRSSTWNTNQDREFYAGYLTNLNIWDDVYLITGTANGTSMDGEAYTIATNSALQVNIGCHWIVKGSFTLTLGSYPTYPIVFDYGAGVCDAAATATLDGTTYNFNMY